jgi:hypothetical protein
MSKDASTTKGGRGKAEAPGKGKGKRGLDPRGLRGASGHRWTSVAARVAGDAKPGWGVKAMEKVGHVAPSESMIVKPGPVDAGRAVPATAGSRHYKRTRYMNASRSCTFRVDMVIEPAVNPLGPEVSQAATTFFVSPGNVGTGPGSPVLGQDEHLLGLMLVMDGEANDLLLNEKVIPIPPADIGVTPVEWVEVHFAPDEWVYLTAFSAQGHVIEMGTWFVPF